MSTSPNDIEAQTDDVPEADYQEEATPAQQQATSSESQLLAQLVADPDIQLILQARNSGKQVKITTNDETSESESTPEEDYTELEEFGPDAKKLVGLIDKKIGSRLDPVVEEVSLLKSLAATLQKREVTDQIAAVSKKHPDFDKYRKAMAEMSRTEGTAGLGVEELLLIAKNRAGDLSVTVPSTDSEKPTPTPRRKGSLVKKETAQSGRRHFQTVLADALDRIEFPQ